MNRFEKGDEVVIINNTAISHSIKIGGIGTIREYCGIYDNQKPYYLVEGFLLTGHPTIQYINEVDLDFPFKASKFNLPDELFEI